MKTFEIEKKTFEKGSNDKMLVRMLANIFVGIANHANMRLSPTMLANIYNKSINWPTFFEDFFLY